MPGQVTGPWEEAFGHLHEEVWRGVWGSSGRCALCGTQRGYLCWVWGLHHLVSGRRGAGAVEASCLGPPSSISPRQGASTRWALEF